MIAGRPWFDATHRALDPEVRIEWHIAEGDAVTAGTVLALLHGRSRSLVSAERTSLISCRRCPAPPRPPPVTWRRWPVPARASSTPAKTLPAPGAEARCAGGENQSLRVTGNHIRAAGSLAAAVAAARREWSALPLVVEVEDLAQLRQALEAGCERIPLDDFSPDLRREAVRITAGRIPLEVSGSVGLGGLRSIAEDGVDCISIGGLTKHVQAIDLSLKLGPPPG